MKGSLHHIALNVQDFDWYTDFFQQIFEMSIRKTAGVKPARKIWFHEGLQINEASEEDVPGTAFDHFSLQVNDIPSAVESSLLNGCTKASNGENWIVLPNGVKIEFMA